jgi:hypothetical protein
LEVYILKRLIALCLALSIITAMGCARIGVTPEASLVSESSNAETAVLSETSSVQESVIETSAVISETLVSETEETVVFNNTFDFTNSTGRTITALYVKSSDVEDFDDNNLIAEPFTDGEVRQFHIDVDGIVYDLRVVYEDGTVNDINDVFLGYVTAATFIFENDLSSLEYTATSN